MSAGSYSAVVGSEEVQAWISAFKAHNKWKGLYDYDGRSVTFTLVVNSADDNIIKATLGDHVTQLELTGTINCLLVFLFFISSVVCLVPRPQNTGRSCSIS